MNLPAFDTLEFIRTLENSGIPREHAEAITTAQKQALSEMVAAKELATKLDLLELEKRLNENMNDLRTELKDDMAALRTELKDDMAALRAELKDDMRQFREEIKGNMDGLIVIMAKDKAEMHKWLFGTILTTLGVGLAAIATMITLFH